MERFEILKNLVAFNTIKDKQNKEIINYIEEYLKSLGFKTEYKTKDLVMSYGQNQKLGFLGHTDTVEYIEEFKNPFTLTEKDGYLYGLGVCDMKGGIAAFLDALSKIDLSKLKKGINMYLTYDEEILFGGIDELVSNKVFFPQYMVFGEPTNNVIFTGHKGLFEFNVNFKGIKAHSSNPDKGISANLNAVSFISDLRKYYETEIKVEKNDKFEIPFTTMNVGIINGGTARNSVPAFCNVGVDFRISKKEHISKLVNKVNELAEKYSAEVEVIDLTEPFVDEIEFLKDIKTTNFMTEAARLPQCKRMILGTGPVTAHEVNENISIKSYEMLVEQYKELIKKICG